MREEGQEGCGNAKAAILGESDCHWFAGMIG